MTYRPPRCARRGSSRAVTPRSRKRQAPAFVIAVAALLAAAGSATADPSISSKQSEARQVLAQIDRLDMSLERAVEAWNSANVKLGAIERDQKRARFELGVAKANLRHAQAALESRLVTIYTSANESSALEVLLGSSSLDDLVKPITDANPLCPKEVDVFVRKCLRYHPTERPESMKEVFRSLKELVARRKSEKRKKRSADDAG